jgi:hypothetical protein
VSAQAYIRVDGGFAVRPCVVLDLSDTGVKISIDLTKSVSNEFTFMAARRADGPS